MGWNEEVHVAAACADGAMGDPVGELEIEERRSWRVQLNVVLPELAVTAHDAAHRLAMNVDRRVVALNAERLFEEFAETEHASLPNA